MVGEGRRGEEWASGEEQGLTSTPKGELCSRTQLCSPTPSGVPPHLWGTIRILAEPVFKELLRTGSDRGAFVRFLAALFYRKVGLVKVLCRGAGAGA